MDWNQPAPDGSGKPLIPNEVVHALVQHFEALDLSNQSVPPDVLGGASEYLIKQFAAAAGAKAGEFFTPPEVVDTLVSQAGAGADHRAPRADHDAPWAQARPSLRHGTANQVGQLLGGGNPLLQLAAHPRAGFGEPLAGRR